MKTIFNPIGSTFQYGSVTLRVVESHDNGASCHGCWYNGYHYDDRMKKKRNYTEACMYHCHLCTAGNREDNKFVVFKKVD